MSEARERFEIYKSRQEVQNLIEALKHADLIEPQETRSIRSRLHQTSLRSVVTYSLLVALCIPTVLFFTEHLRTPVSPLESPVRGGSLPPAEAAKNALRTQYAAIFKEKSLTPLTGEQALGEPWRAYLTGLFAKSYWLSVFLEIDHRVQPLADDQKHFQIPFLQVITTLDDEYQPTHIGPLRCVADMQQDDTGAWIIEELQENPDYPGQCLPVAG